MNLVISIIGIFLLLIINFSPINIGNDLQRYLNLGLFYIVSFNLFLPVIQNFRLKSKSYTLRKDLMELLVEEYGISLEIYSAKKVNSGCINFELLNGSVVVLSEELEQKMNQEELKFILLHEHYHIIKRHSKVNLLSLVVTLAVIPVLVYFATAFDFLLENLAVFIIMAVFIYVSGYILHYKAAMGREFKADQYATQFSGKSVATSVFEKLRTLYGDTPSYNIFNTHPSIKDRIEKISIFDIKDKVSE